MIHSSQLGLLCWVLLLAFGAGAGLAKEPNTEHTFKLGASQSPAADLSQASMLVGVWSGTAFGQEFEETWNPPSAGTMVGMFKVFDQDKGVSFYELMVIEEVEGSLLLKIKHFNADFSGWEEKDDYVAMPLVQASEDALHFNGLSFYRTTSDQLTAYIALGQEGEIKEERLVYKRQVGAHLN